jgi:segregation and condensation protein A
MSDSSEYKVELDAFSGPLDLLLYLIRREEVDIWDIPVARITEQYVKYLDLMGELNINVAGEFIVMAATLIEIKSRMLAPEPVQAEEENLVDPRMELVRQLMEYRRFKEAAAALTERAEDQARRFGRTGEKPPTEEADRTAGPAGVTIWTLLDAFSKVLEHTGAARDHRLVLDTIPQEQINAELEERLRTVGRANFFSLFEGQASRVRIVGTFLALLELVKQQALRVEQEAAFGDIWIVYVPPGERAAWDAPEPPIRPAEAEVAPPTSSDTEEEYGEEWPEEEGLSMPDVDETGASEE